jgi:hypothetical protein
MVGRFLIRLAASMIACRACRAGDARRAAMREAHLSFVWIRHAAD